VSLASIFIIACGWILVRDRRDWMNYVVVALAAIFFAGTKWGSQIGPWMVARGSDIDGIIKGLFGVSVLDVSPLLGLFI
jgi:hypothetical protein